LLQFSACEGEFTEIRVVDTEKVVR